MLQCSLIPQETDKMQCVPTKEDTVRESTSQSAAVALVEGKYQQEEFQPNGNKELRQYLPLSELIN